MKNVFTLLFFLSSFLCINHLNAQETKEWTLLVYMVGSDIVNDGITDLGEMMAAGSTDNIHIAAMLGGSNLNGWQTPTTSTFENGVEVSQSFVPSVSNMANSTNITEFINWGVENYPAEKYMLLFYNHGMAIRGFGYDETVDHSNSVSDIQAGIGASNFIVDGNKFEVLGFDACLMATFEAMSALQNFAHYYVASEETEPWHAWNWTPIITAMNSQTGLTGDQLGHIIVDNYFTQSQTEGTQHVTLSVVELAQINALQSSLETLITSLNDDIYVGNMIRARAMSEEFAKAIANPAESEDMVDMGDLVKHLKELEPTIATQCDDVLNKIDNAVTYHRGDATHPLSTGISMFVPLNTLTNSAEVQFRVEENYNLIGFSGVLKDFIVNNYLTLAQSDDNPLAGTIDIDFNLRSQHSDSRTTLNTNYSAIKVEDRQDMDHLQVVLLEELSGIPDEFILLGSTYADTMVANTDGTHTFAYLWDDQWLSLNGHPAYIADIQHFDDVPDANGNFEDGFTRIHIPALLNPGTEQEKEIVFSFAFDEDFNHELESILREHYGENVIVPSKERIQLQPGDQVQLIYEIFDATTNEAYFVPNENAIITIENGNQDLDLSHAPLEPGSYHIGFVLMDHAQNDTLIYDPFVHEVMAVGTENIAVEEFGVSLSPNPTSDWVKVQFDEPIEGTLELYDQQGKLHFVREFSGTLNTEINLETLPNGVYWLYIINGDQTVSRKLIKT